MEEKFVQTAQSILNPYNRYSGTEYVAPLLYSLVRMTRPKTIVEVGSGYSTLFMLKALADNRTDYVEEAALLKEKTLLLGNLDEVDVRTLAVNPDVLAWLNKPGKDCSLNPKFYLSDYQPHLFGFERHPPEHEYVKSLLAAVEQSGLRNLFTLAHTSSFSASMLPEEHLPIDLAWNDDDDYVAFFEAFWPYLNPAGGMMIFHNASGAAGAWADVEHIRKSMATEEGFELLMLEEPHKFRQNGCAIFRRTSNYTPSFKLNDPFTTWQNLKKFMKL